MIEETTSPKDWASLLRISKSHIQTYLICPRKFYFQYVVALPWEFVPASLPFGSALHAAVAFFYRMLTQGETPDLAFVLSEFKRTWEEETENRTIGFAPGSSKESMEGLGVTFAPEVLRRSPSPERASGGVSLLCATLRSGRRKKARLR